tara:strand:- start:459 stop:944 length:486 start_codon:yes stop_codon:yes gene_type:complete
MSIKIRVVLDWEEEDVLRDLLVPADLNLDQLHLAILQSFQLSPGEMASFYHSNEDWEQGHEIPLMPFDERQTSMKDLQVQHVLGEEGDRLLYVYDFLEMWTFFLEVLSAEGPETERSKVVLIQGMRPEEAPKRPEAQGSNDLFGDLDLDLDEFNDFDDYQE